jgi:cellulose synthase (UDP-forming)
MSENSRGPKVYVAQKQAQRGGVMSILASLLLVTIAASMFFVIVVTPLDLKAQAILGASIFVMALVLNRFKSRYITLVLIGMSIAVSSRYMHWRLTATLGGDWSFETIMAPLLLLAEVYTYVVLLLGYLQTAWPLKRPIAAMPRDSATWPTVDVFIPTYNEPLKVVRATVLAAKAIDWPEEKIKIYILDDGRRNEFREFATKAGVGYLTRSDNLHAKAGNINRALAKTRGEFVAIFDCDHVPVRSFLQSTMGWFINDERMAMMQTPHHFYSADPVERNLATFKLVPNEGELFYGLIQPGNDLYNAVFFCGSCAVLRRTALDEVGGIAVETVTEDAHTALKMHRRGWKTGYISETQAAGLATESLSAHVGQRIRWARGMAQIFRVDNPIIGRGLDWAQRLCYTSAMVHFFYGIPRLIFLLAPLSFLYFGAHIFNATPLLVIAYALPHLAHSTMTNSRLQGRFRHSFWAEVYETILAYYIMIPTTVALINPKAGSFNVTAKGGYVENDYFDARISTPYLILLALNLGGIGFGVYKFALGLDRVDAIAINMFWAFYNIFVLGAVLAVAWEKRQVRDSNRVSVKLPVMLIMDNGHTVSCETTDVSQGGVNIKGLRAHDFETNQPVTASLLVGYDEYPLPARVIEQRGDTVRFRFDNLTLQEEGWLVSALFARLDSWRGWSANRKPDRPFIAIITILRESFRGLFRTLGILVSFNLKRMKKV